MARPNESILTSVYVWWLALHLPATAFNLAVQNNCNKSLTADGCNDLIMMLWHRLLQSILVLTAVILHCQFESCCWQMQGEPLHMHTCDHCTSVYLYLDLCLSNTAAVHLKLQQIHRCYSQNRSWLQQGQEATPNLRLSGNIAGDK